MQVDPVSPVTSDPPTPVEEVDPKKRAEKVKEEGNLAFKGSKFQNAIELYSRAIGASPLFS